MTMKIGVCLLACSLASPAAALEAVSFQGKTVSMIVGYSASLSVFYATAVTFALSFLRKETALVPKKRASRNAAQAQ